jgi:putative tricarboxylic transport membrane protein
VLCVIGANALNNTMDDVWTLLLFGVLGYLMVKSGFRWRPSFLVPSWGTRLRRT